MQGLNSSQTSTVYFYVFSADIGKVILVISDIGLVRFLLNVNSLIKIKGHLKSVTLSEILYYNIMEHKNPPGSNILLQSSLVRNT